MLLLVILGGLMNAVRGGQWRIWLGAEYLAEDDNGKHVKLDWLNADILNSLVYGLTVLVITGDWKLAGWSTLAMQAGATPGWGDYIGALFGYRLGKLKENRFIDFFIRPLLNYPFWWGFTGLFIRGAWWGINLAIPFWLFGYHAVALQFVICSLAMPAAYLAVGAWMRTRWVNSPGWIDASWGLGEIFYGAILWSALGGA